MNINIILEIAKREFQQKLTEFCQDRDFSTLTPENAEEFSRGLHEGLRACGMSAYKAFIEGYESTEKTVSRDGIVLRFKQISSKMFLTPFGKIKMTRRLYQADRGGRSCVPLDEKWAMQGEYATVDVRESILYSVAQLTPEETSCLLNKCALFHPSATAIKHIISASGKQVESAKEELDERIREEERVPDDTDAVAVSLDGVNVLLAEAGKRKGRKAQRPKSGEPDSQRTAYRNAMVGSISYYSTRDGNPERLESRYTARMPQKNFLTFRNQFEQEVQACFEKLPPDTKRIVITDGHPALEKYIPGTELFKHCDILIDFYHAMEHLSLAAEAIFGKSSEAGKVWYGKWRGFLLQEEKSVKRLYRSMKYYCRSLRGIRAKDLRSQMLYFKKRQRRMNYAYYRNKGLPIASGPVEAACKSIVKTRLCRSGMRWSREGGQNILNLRTYLKSGRWDAFWNHYKADSYQSRIAA